MPKDRKSRQKSLRRGLHETQLSDAETRVARQLRIVERLRALRLPTEKAEQRLRVFNFKLMQIQNYHDMMASLLAPPKGRVTRIEGY